MASSSEETLPQLPDNWQNQKVRDSFRDWLADAMLDLSCSEDGPSELVEGQPGWKMITHGVITRAQCEQAAIEIIDLIVELHTQGSLLADDQLFSGKRSMQSGDKTLTAFSRAMVLWSMFYHYKGTVILLFEQGPPGKDADLRKRRYVSQPQGSYREVRAREVSRKNKPRSGDGLSTESEWRPTVRLEDVIDCSSNPSIPRSQSQQAPAKQKAPDFSILKWKAKLPDTGPSRASASARPTIGVPSQISSTASSRTSASAWQPLGMLVPSRTSVNAPPWKSPSSTDVNTDTGEGQTEAERIQGNDEDSTIEHGDSVIHDEGSTGEEEDVAMRDEGSCPTPFINLPYQQMD